MFCWCRGTVIGGFLFAGEVHNWNDMASVALSYSHVGKKPWSEVVRPRMHVSNNKFQFIRWFGCFLKRWIISLQVISMQKPYRLLDYCHLLSHFSATSITHAIHGFNRTAWKNAFQSSIFPCELYFHFLSQDFSFNRNSGFNLIAWLV